MWEWIFWSVYLKTEGYKSEYAFLNIAEKSSDSSFMGYDNFQTSLNFNIPKWVTEWELVFQNNNPSGFEESNETFTIPVRFASYDSIPLISSLKSRLDTVLKKLKNKLDSKFEDSDDKIDYIDDIISKFKELADRKPKYEAIVDYLIWELERIKWEYEDGLWEIFEMLE